MKTYYYSPSSGGFYLESIHGTGMPADVVPVSEDDWRQLLEAQSAGMEIRPGEDGRPVAMHPVAP